MEKKTDRRGQPVQGAPAALAVLLGAVAGILLGLFFDPQGLAHGALQDRQVASKEGLRRLLDRMKERILR